MVLILQYRCMRLQFMISLLLYTTTTTVVVAVVGAFRALCVEEPRYTRTSPLLSSQFQAQFREDPKCFKSVCKKVRVYTLPHVPASCTYRAFHFSIFHFARIRDNPRSTQQYLTERKWTAHRTRTTCTTVVLQKNATIPR